MNWKKITKDRYINLDCVDCILITNHPKEENYFILFEFSRGDVRSDLFKTFEEAENFLDKILERK